MEIRGKAFVVFRDLAIRVEIIGSHIGILEDLIFSVSDNFEIEQFLDRVKIEIAGKTVQDFLEEINFEPLLSIFEDDYSIATLQEAVQKAAIDFNEKQIKVPPEPKVELW